jgi:hypothetical protein
MKTAWPVFRIEEILYSTDLVPGSGESPLRDSLPGTFSQKKVMSEKRFFQILDELNVKDTKEGTALVRIGMDMVAADYNANGTIIKMGVSGNVVLELLDESVVPIIILVDRAAYNKQANDE